VATCQHNLISVSMMKMALGTLPQWTDYLRMMTCTPTYSNRCWTFGNLSCQIVNLPRSSFSAANDVDTKTGTWGVSMSYPMEHIHGALHGRTKESNDDDAKIGKIELMRHESAPYSILRVIVVAFYTCSPGNSGTVGCRISSLMNLPLLPRLERSWHILCPNK
jgi:hypothetical protein